MKQKNLLKMPSDYQLLSDEEMIMNESGWALDTENRKLYLSIADLANPDMKHIKDLLSQITDLELVKKQLAAIESKEFFEEGIKSRSVYGLCIDCSYTTSRSVVTNIITTFEGAKLASSNICL